MIQPFTRIEGLSSTKYSAVFVGNEAKELVDKKRYEVLVELDPWDKLVSCVCECNGFKFRNHKDLLYLIRRNTNFHYGEI